MVDALFDQIVGITHIGNLECFVCTVQSIFQCPYVYAQVLGCLGISTMFNDSLDQYTLVVAYDLHASVW